MNSKTDQSIQTKIIRRNSLTRVACFDSLLPEDLVDVLWQRPESLAARGETLRRSSLRWTVRLDWGSQLFVLKHYRPTWWHAVRQLTRPSRAWSTWTFTHKLIDGGIATPRPVACIENRWGQLRRDSYLIYPYVAGRTLRSYFSNEAKESQRVADDLWRQLAELWQQLENLQASLEDANTGNFIVCPAGHIWVIDLDRGCIHRLAETARREQQRAWKKLQGSVAKCNAGSRQAKTRLAA